MQGSCRKQPTQVYKHTTQLPTHHCFSQDLHALHTATHTRPKVQVSCFQVHKKQSFRIWIKSLFQVLFAFWDGLENSLFGPLSLGSEALKCSFSEHLIHVFGGALTRTLKASKITTSLFFKKTYRYAWLKKKGKVNRIPGIRIHVHASHWLESLIIYKSLDTGATCKVATSFRACEKG